MNYAVKYKLKKDHSLFGRPKTSSENHVCLEENDVCVFFCGDYKKEVYEASLSKHRRFIYFHSSDDINTDSIRYAILKYNASDGKSHGKTIRMKCYMDRCLIVLKMIEGVSCSPPSVYRHPPSSPILQSSLVSMTETVQGI